MTPFNPNAYFNELSLSCHKDADPSAIFMKYAETIKSIKEYGFNGVRYESGIASLCNNVLNIFKLQEDPNTKTLFLIILSTARYPYIQPNDEDRESEKERHSSHQIYIDGSWVDSIGFAAAYPNNGIGISLDTKPLWQTNKFKIRRKDEPEKEGAVLNVVSPKDLSKTEVQRHIELLKPISLEETTIDPKIKKCSFRRDHGIDKLKKCWMGLRNSKYVIEAINSLEFKPTGSEFIEKCFDDGKIHIRLKDTDAGYGMVIQTTGRNIRETVEIGYILSKKYG
ncbi:MAG: hypothetical protein Q4C37_00895 [Bacteroidales bacterium]|nr:hypothetical protein [Bacteroidales bacterium]